MKIKFCVTTVAMLVVFAGFALAEFLPFSFPKDETVVFENKSPGKQSSTVSNTYYKSGNNFVIKVAEQDGSITKITVDKNFIPKNYKKIGKSGSTLEYANYAKGKLNIKIPARNINKTVKLPDKYYDPYTLYYVFRKFPFGKKDSVIIYLVYHDPGNIRVVKMQVKYKGKETVKIKSGKFECYRLELGTVNPLDVAIWPYKYNFWFTTDQNRHFVKFSGREKDASLITSELATYKVGNKYVVKKSSSSNSRSDLITSNAF